MNSQDLLYQGYKRSVYESNEIKKGQRIISPLVTAYGLGVIATASIFSAVLSIERTSSKNK